MNEGLKGLDELLRKLDTIKDRTAKKAAKAGVNAGLTALAKAERSAINASSASPELKRAARQTIGKRLLKKEGKDYIGKAGFEVGAKKERATKIIAAKRRHNKRGGGGVGISANNVHWAVYGTKDRNLNEKTYGRGENARQVKTVHGDHPTGRMPPILAGVIKSAASIAALDMLEAAKKKISEVLEREAAKTGG